MNNAFNYKTINCKSALNHINSFLPYSWDLNIYRGCEHRCAYCYAQYSHRYLEDNDFFHNIYVKENIIEQLEAKLKSKSWKREVINLGGVTDSYQPAEKQFKIMPDVLKLLIKYKTPAIISTKSSLILRDIELLKELSEVAGIQIAVTLTTLDQSIADNLEPGASSVKDRINTIIELKKAGLTVGWHLMPIIPFLTATNNNLEQIFKMASKCKIDYMIAGMLNLRGSTRTNFFKFMSTNYPSKKEMLWKVYYDKEYKKKLYTLINSLSDKYEISRDYNKYVPKIKQKKVSQLSMF